VERAPFVEFRGLHRILECCPYRFLAHRDIAAVEVEEDEIIRLSTPLMPLEYSPGLQPRQAAISESLAGDRRSFSAPLARISHK
jgi:hypothetical protein